MATQVYLDNNGTVTTKNMTHAEGLLLQTQIDDATERHMPLNHATKLTVQANLSLWLGSATEIYLDQYGEQQEKSMPAGGQTRMTQAWNDACERHTPIDYTILLSTARNLASWLP